MEPDLEHRILGRFDEIERHLNELMSSCDTPDASPGDRQRLLLALDERLALLADSHDHDSQ